MKHFITIATCLFVMLSGSAQTIIDLSAGGKVRAKTIDDYRNEQTGILQRLHEDSLAYVQCLTQAFNALHADSLATAEKCFRKALKLRPDAPGNYVVHYNLGLIYTAQNQHTKAFHQYNDALKLKPENPQALQMRAQSHLYLGNATAAITDCNSLLRQEPDTTTKIATLFVRYAAHMQVRLHANARSDLEQIIRLQPHNDNAHLLLSNVDEAEGRHRQALERLDRLVQGRPEWTEALVARAELEMKQSLFALAEADASRAIEQDSQNATLYLLRARAKLKQGQRAAAKADLERANELGIPIEELRPYLRSLHTKP
ncbi:MAG: tetratricopeptide repeat protein [Bacteroidaceae bacterium]|nr:tetratricopeptide repeat protein [Bacteroidaceae bacterium]